MILSEIRIHPLKSAGATVLQRTELDRFGPVGDRRWMAVDSEGVFLSQRKTPELALVRPRLRGEALELTREGMPHLTVASDGDRRRHVRVWKDEMEVVDCGDEAADWLSRAIRRPCRLVRLADGVRRRVGSDGGAGAPVSFVDGYPLLLLSRASLADLNERLPAPLPVDRFRPNLVIEGTEPYGEDGWRRIEIGGVPIDVVTPCARCAITTTDQRTAERGKEPLRTLARYRRRGSDVLFAQNAVHRATGVLTVGDPVRVLETGPSPSFDSPPGEG